MTRHAPSRASAGAGRRAAALVLLALVAGAPAGFAQESVEPEPPRIRHIIFPGAEHLSERTLRGVMRLKAQSWWQPFRRNYYYGPDHLEADLGRVLLRYRDAGFPFARFEEARVRYVSPDRVDLELPVREGACIRVHRVDVQGVAGALRERLTSSIDTRPGSPAREVALQTEEEKLRQICEEEGYGLAEVTREMHFRADSVDVRYWIAYGPLARFGEVHVTGVERTREHVVRREARMKSGDVLRRSRILNYQSRLFDLGLFRSVRITPAFCDTCPPTQGEIVVDLVAAVSEKKPGWYGFGLGYSSADQVRLVGEWGYRNLMGRARSLQATALVAYPVGAALKDVGAGVKERQLELTYTEPWVFRTPLRGQVRGYLRYNREATLEEDILGLALQARRDLGRWSALIGSIESKWIQTTDTTVARAHYQTRFLSVALSQDRRDFPLDPHTGQLSLLLAEYAGGFLGGSASFVRWTGSHAAYQPLGRAATAAYRVRLGYIHPIGRGVAQTSGGRELLSVPFDERFRVGGGTTVRGHAEKSLGPYDGDQPLGGLALVVANAELRFPVFWQISGALFLDAGNLWEDYRQITAARWTRGLRSREFSDLDLNYSMGVGVRLRTPVGPLRLDYGTSLNRALRPGTSRSEWHFSLGQAF
jgi:outer membrane protein assembly complex protein YaeT